MARASLIERLDGLEARRERLEARAIQEARAVSPVHAQAANVLTELLGMGEMFMSKGGDVPVSIRTLLRSVEHLRPELERQLATVDPREMAAFMEMLSGKISRVAEAARELPAELPPAPPPSS